MSTKHSPAIDHGIFGRIRDGQPVAKTLDQWRRNLRHAGLRLVVTNGCFDLLALHHVALLEEAATYGHLFLVAINTDGCVRRLKGPERPIQPYLERVGILRALACVDAVVGFSGRTPEKLYEVLRPDVLVKGGDAVPPFPGQQYAGKIVQTAKYPGSTTELIARIRGDRIE